jgi:N6-adenosine-specific RNA methylase IME4
MTVKEFKDAYTGSPGIHGAMLADPPWYYVNQATRAATGKHYPQMSLGDIKRLPVARLAAMPCALFLWATWPNLPSALEVIDAWGFEYKTIAWVWIKLNKAGEKPIMGLGNYTRANTEPCLLAFKKVKTRGRAMPVADHGVPSWIMAPRREHSQKPDEQYDFVQRLYPEVPKLELFARHIWPGWDAWGQEIESTVQLYP